MDREETINLLRDDNEYYGGVGKKFLSNSDIGNLLNNPSAYGIPREDNPVFAKGRYFHQSILEPDKVKDFPFIDVNSRNSVKYKEAVRDSGKPFLLLEKEIQDIKGWVSALLQKVDMYDLITGDNAVYEVPSIGMIEGLMWKGKADILTDRAIIDLKTTGDIMKFRYSAKAYNYDSQAYIYQTLFGKPLEFIAVDKTTKVVGHFTCSENFIMGGKDKVERAANNYKDYFHSETATRSVEEFIITDTL
jgi:hypothetical protein